MEACKINTESVDLFLKKFTQFYKKLNTELNTLKKQREVEENNTSALDQAITDVIAKIKQINDEKLIVENNIKQEELKLKTCSDETMQKLETTNKDLDRMANVFKEKQQYYRNKLGIDIQVVDGETKCLKYTFLANKQEIQIQFISRNNIKAFYTELAEDIDKETRDSMDKIIEEFNESDSKTTKEFLDVLRELFTTI